jgi:aminoglycoside 6'-N-acetyltransferase I
MHIAPLTSTPDPHWLLLRKALWPDATDAEHEEEIAGFVAEPARFGQFIARSSAGEPLGLAEVSLRCDYVNGTQTSPVAFLEGLYVAPHVRRRGIARALLREVKAWARERACSELASDTTMDNALSQCVHLSLGFSETERVVYFNLELGNLPP